MADNYNPTPQDLEALDALMRRALPLGEYHSFMDGVSLVYLHRVVQTARAEAQDEGADLSDEDHAIIRRCVERQPKLYVRGQHEGYYIHSDIAALIDMIGRAHPSPTPAADADRVREAIALAEYVCGLLPSLAGAADQPDNKVYAAYANKREIMGARDRLAALKSTAAKEGGES